MHAIIKSNIPGARFTKGNSAGFSKSREVSKPRDRSFENFAILIVCSQVSLTLTLKHETIIVGSRYQLLTKFGEYNIISNYSRDTLYLFVNILMTSVDLWPLKTLKLFWGQYTTCWWSFENISHSVRELLKPKYTWFKSVFWTLTFDIWPRKKYIYIISGQGYTWWCSFGEDIPEFMSYRRRAENTHRKSIKRTYLKKSKYRRVVSTKHD